MSKDSAMSLLIGNPAPAPNVGTPPPNVVETPNVGTSNLQSTPFNQLAKKEADLVRQRNEFKKERETVEAERDRLGKAAQEYHAYQEAKKTDPVAALKMIGFNETDIFNYMAAQQKPELTPEQRAIQAAEQAADAKIKAFEEGQIKKEKDAQLVQDRGLIQGFKQEVTGVMQKNPDQYEYCNFYGKPAQDLAYEVTLEVVRQSKGQDIITAKEAADMVEEFYEEQDKLMSSLKKRQPQAPATAPTQKEPERTRTLSTPPDNPDKPKPTITHSRTLHNGATSTVASTRQTRNETREQKRERLIEALRNGAKP